MKHAKTTLVVLLTALLMGNVTLAQNNKKAKKAETKAPTETAAAKPQETLITVTKMHRNLDKKDGSQSEWLALEKEYFDKVTNKNDLILGANVLTHYFTEDNSEMLIVHAYANWTNIEKAADKNDELIKAGWPDEAARKSFFKKKGSYYAENHSDEIYQTIPGSKLMKSKPDKSMLYYVRKSHFAYPETGSEKDFGILFNKYIESVTYKNDMVKAYYPHVHAWGADNTEFTEVFVVDELADIEKMFDKDDELFKATWTDEAKQREFDDAFNKYFIGTHSDFIYRSVPELVK
jgi:hypothetical protein